MIKQILIDLMSKSDSDLEAILTPEIIETIESLALSGYEDNGHALISPSGAGRWSRCSGSLIKIHEGRKRSPDNVPAVEGTGAHHLLERSLLTETSPSVLKEMITPHLAKELGDWAKHVLSKDTNGDEVKEYITTLVRRLKVSDYPDEMRDHISVIYDMVMSYVARGYKLIPEARCDLKWALGHSQCNGSSDVVLYKGDGKGGGHLIVLDLKYGMYQEVFPKKSLQLQLYALGVLGLIRNEGIIPGKITIVISQPRPHDRYWDEWQTNYEALLSFGRSMRVKSVRALMAIAISEHFKSPDEIPKEMFSPSKSACEYCYLRSECVSRRDEALRLTKRMFAAGGATLTDNEWLQIGSNTKPLSNDDVSDLMDAKPFIESFLKDIEELAYSRLRGGSNIGGRRLGEGRLRRSFKLSGDDLTTALLRLGVPEPEMYASKLKSPAQLEKSRIPKDVWQIVDSELVVKSHGAPVMLSATNSRPSIKEVNERRSMNAFAECVKKDER